MGSKKYQYGAALCANLITIGHGAVCGWPSAAVMLLMSNQSPLPTGPISLNDASWITALMCAGGLVGNFVFGWITERYGRKLPLIALAIPSIVGWALIMLAQNVTHLYIARFLNGLTGGGAYVITPAFVAEIAEDKIRGTLGSMLVLTCNVGILLIFILGNYATYEFAPKLVIGIQLLFLCTFPFFPESPQFLLKQNKTKEAEESLRFYRGTCQQDNADCELLQAEFDKLKLVHSDQHKSKEADTNNGLCLDDFKSIEARKSLLISIVLVVLNQLCGCFAMLNYTSKFFTEAGSDLSPNMSAIVVGVIQLIGSYITLLMVDRFGRKLLMCVSAMGICLGQVCLGSYALLKDQGFDVDDYRWINVVCFSFVIFIAAWGVLSLPFLIISEILPGKIRNFGMSFSMVVLSFFAFMMLKMFPYISDALGVDGSMFLYAGCSFSGAMFVLFYMPETKGRSFEEIAELLRK